jgi:hypothetical protein
MKRIIAIVSTAALLAGMYGNSFIETRPDRVFTNTVAEFLDPILGFTFLVTYGVAMAMLVISDD